MGIAPLPYRPQGPPQEEGLGHLEALRTLQGVVAPVSRDSGPAERLFLCCRWTGVPLHLSGSLSHGRGRSMEHILHPHLDRREVLTMTGYSFARGSTCRSNVYSARSCCSVGLYHMSAPSRAGTKVLGVLSRLLSLLVSPPYLLESQIHLT